MLNKDFWVAFFGSPVWTSPFCLGILSLGFVVYLVHAVVVPLVHVVTDTIPMKMDVVISKLDVCLSERVATVPKKGENYAR